MAVKVDRDLDRAVSKLVPHIGEAGARLNEQGSVGMPQIMNPKVSESGFPDGGKEIPSVHVPTVQWGSSFGREHQLIDNRTPTRKISVQHAPIPLLDQDRMQLPGQIYSAFLAALGFTKLTLDPIPPNVDETVLVVPILAKLNVSPA